jgi:hypothetical protein
MLKAYDMFYSIQNEVFSETLEKAAMSKKSKKQKL